MASAVCFHVCPNRMLDYWTPSRRQSHQCFDTGREEPRQRTWTVNLDQKGPHWWGNDLRHDDSEEELLGPGLAPEGCQCKRELVNKQGWTNIEERSYYGSSEQVSSSADTMNIIFQ